jgi:hypothetical protein
MMVDFTGSFGGVTVLGYCYHDNYTIIQLFKTHDIKKGYYFSSLESVIAWDGSITQAETTRSN